MPDKANEPSQVALCCPVQSRYPMLRPFVSREAGATRHQCHYCGQDVWANPRAVEVMLAGTALLVCQDCFVDLAIARYQLEVPLPHASYDPAQRAVRWRDS